MKQPPDIATKEALRRVTWTLHRAELAILAAKEPGFRSIGVPRSQYGLLMHAYSFPGNSGAELARRMGVTTQAVATLAAKLQERGLLERRAHSRHHNVQELYVTAAGLEVLQRAEGVVVAVEEQALDVLGPEKAEQLRELLEIVIAGMDKTRK